MFLFARGVLDAFLCFGVFPDANSHSPLVAFPSRDHHFSNVPKVIAYKPNIFLDVDFQIGFFPS